MKNMKNILFALAFFSCTVFFAQESIKTITGKITDGRNTIENVAVAIQGKKYVDKYISMQFQIIDFTQLFLRVHWTNHICTVLLLLDTCNI